MPRREPLHITRIFGHRFIEPLTGVELHPNLSPAGYLLIPFIFKLEEAFVSKTIQCLGVAETYSIHDRYTCPQCGRTFFLNVQFRVHAGRCILSMVNLVSDALRTARTGETFYMPAITEPPPGNSSGLHR